MMKKLLILALGCAALFLVVAPAAQAASQPFYAQVGNETPAAEGPVWVRYYTTANDKVNPSGSNNCKGTWDPPYCEVPHTNKPNKNKVGYLGYLEDIFNYDGNEGNQYHAVWDTEFGSGSTDHRGYYAWMARVVNVGMQSSTWTAGCAGTTLDRACLGSAEPDNAAGTDIENTPLGTISPHGGLRPIPVPLPTGVDGDVIHLSWDAVTSIGDDVSPQYYLYYVVRDATCDAPTADEFDDAHRLGPYTETTADVNVADLGFSSSDQKGVFFALRIKYPDAAGNEVLSRYLSANSQCIVFGGFAAEVVNIQAKWLRRNQVQVSWETSLEDGVVGFYVQRAFTPNGPFERVSDLVPANGEPSKYTFIDNVRVNGRIAASGLYYKIEAVDANEGQKVFGPAQAELPVGGQRKIKTRKGFRF